MQQQTVSAHQNSCHFSVRCPRAAIDSGGDRNISEKLTKIYTKAPAFVLYYRKSRLVNGKERRRMGCMEKGRAVSLKKLWRLLPAILLMALIFYFSAEDATASAQSSGNTMLWLLRLFHVSDTDAIVQNSELYSTRHLDFSYRSHGRRTPRFRSGNARRTRCSAGSSTRQATSCTNISSPAGRVRCATCASIPPACCSDALSLRCFAGSSTGTGEKRTAQCFDISFFR